MKSRELEEKLFGNDKKNIIIIINDVFFEKRNKTCAISCAFHCSALLIGSGLRNNRQRLAFALERARLNIFRLHADDNELSINRGAKNFNQNRRLIESKPRLRSIDPNDTSSVGKHLRIMTSSEPYKIQKLHRCCIIMQWNESRLSHLLFIMCIDRRPSNTTNLHIRTPRP